MTSTGTIFDIKRFSIHDGPGIRSTVFFKGCPLSCKWCHNPESQSPQPELIFRPERCLNCGSCAEVCPAGITVINGGEIHYLSNGNGKCQICGKCSEVCYPGARELIGREVTPGEVLEELLQDLPFYLESGGGVTFSGGEPLYQPDFLEDILKLSKENGLHTALDTCGSCGWEDLERQLPYLDMVLYDLKLLDDGLHKDFTGASNRKVLENYQRLTRSKVELRIRRPVIPGVNDSRAEIQALTDFIQNTNGVKRIDLLPYHALSADKYLRLGREENANWVEPSREEQERITAQLLGEGFEVKWGG
jgi:pyruvate formate lyase activating enzyme